LTLNVVKVFEIRCGGILSTGYPAKYAKVSVIVIVIVIYLHSVNPMEDTILRMRT
jgi:hypothetical protein